MILAETFATVEDLGKPRASGDDPLPAETAGEGIHVNPARAGMIPVTPWERFTAGSKPRASGDDPAGRESLHVRDG